MSSIVNLAERKPEHRSSPAPKIGIIVPSYNDARIVHTIWSVRRQDPENLTRIYIIDGGSRPEMLSLIRKHLRPHDFLSSEKDKGIFDGINKGLDAVQEEIMTWLGSDDFVTHEVDFKKISQAFEEENLDCYVFDIVFVDDIRTRRRTIAAAPTLANWRVGRHVQHFSSYWRMSRIGNMRFNLAYPIASDMDFFFRLTASGPLNTKLDNTVGTIARLGGFSSKDMRRILKANMECYRIFRQYFGAVGGAIATVCKMARKFESTITKAKYPIVGEMTNLIVTFDAPDNAGK